jgi:quinol-cytochrome oxidoreductase complex cytochrome b subunit
MEWNQQVYYPLQGKTILNYFALLSAAFHDIYSVFGFFVFLIVGNQIISGTMLSFSLVLEPMIVPMVREEEDVEDLYIDDFFWLHERGVDLLFIFTYFHLWRKLYLNVFEYENEAAWKSGVLTFLIFQGVVFFGLVLCCTHLSEITLTIAANIMHTITNFKGKPYWWIFTDKQLNTDTMIRLAYIHYLLAFFMAYLGLIHGIDMHYDWKNETSFDGVDAEMAYWDETISSEFSYACDILMIITIVAWFVYVEPEALSYEIFMWGDIGLVTDVRFYGVAPHWYFRPMMAWLMVCPHHKTGLFGLGFYFVVLFYQPTLHGTSEFNNFNKKTTLFMKYKIKSSKFFSGSYVNLELNLYHHITYATYIGCSLYAASFLPYGRFYNRLGGNIGMLGSYMYLFFYLSFTSLRRPMLLDMYIMSIITRTRLLKKYH